MDYACASSPGDPAIRNEDWCGVGTNVAVVLDGVTSPPELESGCVHGVPWFVRQLGPALLRFAESHELRDALRRAIAHVRSLHEVTCDLEHEGSPCATVCAVRWAGEELEYLVLSDSTLVLDRGGALDVLTDKSLRGVAQAEKREVDRYEVGSREHRAALLAFVTEQRRWRNRLGGYWLASADPEAAAHALGGAVPLGDVNRVALLTDGAACLVETYEATTWGRLLDDLVNAGPELVIGRVREIERADVSGTQWNRYKRSDDATALLLLPRRFGLVGAAGEE